MRTCPTEKEINDILDKLEIDGVCIMGIVDADPWTFRIQENSNSCNHTTLTKKEVLAFAHALQLFASEMEPLE